MAVKKDSVKQYKVIADAVTGLGKIVKYRGDLVTAKDFLPGHFDKYISTKHIGEVTK